MKQKIKFDQHAFDKAQIQLREKQQAFVELKSILSRYIEVDEKELRINPTGYFEKAFIEKHYKLTELGLTFKTLIGNFEVPINEINAAVLKYSNIKVNETKKLDPEDFTLYATTKEQLQRFEAVQNFINAVQIIKKYRPAVNVQQFAGVLHGTINFDGEPAPCANFVLHG